MRPLQNAIAIVATFFAAGALLPWSGRVRLVCALAAAALIFALLVMRMQSHARSIRQGEDAGTQAKIDRIREQRARRFGRRG